MIRIYTAESSHWYNRDNSPCYELPCISRPGEMRAVTLKDARTLHLLPSVTTILNVLSKPALESWKQGRCIEAALKLAPTRAPEETDDAFINRVIEEATSVSRKAADLGTRVHNAIEMYISSGFLADVEEDPRPYIIPAITWFEANVEKVISTEKTFANELLGFGGKVDLVCMLKDGRLAILDWKTQSRDKTAPYDEYGYQAAAYRQGLGQQAATLLNVIISTKEPGRDVHVHEWKNGTELWETFEHAFHIWRARNDFDPRRNGGGK